MTLTSETQEAVYSYDERDGVTSPQEAVTRAIDNAPDSLLDQEPEVEITEIRTVISAEVCPN